MGVTGLTPDDVAAISLAYPEPTQPLALSTATLRGHIRSASSALPVDGVNVVAVELASGNPVVGRLSGGAGEPGAFEILGLPPASYELYFLDGESFAGSNVGLPSTWIQKENFEPFIRGPFTLAAGQVEELGDVSIAFDPMSVDWIGPDPRSGPDDLEQTSGALPAVRRKQLYLHLHGGVHPIEATVHGLPEGLFSAVVPGHRLGGDPQGDNLIWISGRPKRDGVFPIGIDLRDADGNTRSLAYGIGADPLHPFLNLRHGLLHFPGTNSPSRGRYTLAGVIALPGFEPARGCRTRSALDTAHRSPQRSAAAAGDPHARLFTPDPLSGHHP